MGESLRYRVRAVVYIVLVLSLAASPLWSVDVDRDELESQIDQEIEFQNYQGPQEDVDTAEEIAGIGAALASPPLLPGESRDYFGRYRILHAVDPEQEEGLDADILYILEDARVDHIDNVRRILAAYLSGSYGYGEEDAALLAELVTVYNAVHRGSFSFFEERYKDVVTSNLTEAGAGISTLYSDWPGATELVTPLSTGAVPGRLGAIAPLQLTDDMLIEQLRRRPDMGLEERRALVDFLERVIDERREEIEQEREAIEEEREAIEEARAEAEDEPAEEPAPEEPAEEEPEEAPPEAEEEPEEAPAEAKPAEEPTEEAPAEEEPAEEEPTDEELAQREQELEEREQQLDEEEEEVEELEEEVREQRDQIAEDTQEQIEEEEAAPEEEVTPVTFLLSRREDDTVLRRIVGVNPRSGEVLVESPLDSVTSATYVTAAGNLVVVGDHEGQSRLVQVDRESLEVLSFGQAEVAPGSYLATAGGSIYAVVRDGGSWYLGRFDEALELRERSGAEVAPESYIHVAGRRVYAQGADGTVLSLSREGFQE